jgi:hypothetical protein
MLKAELTFLVLGTETKGGGGMGKIKTYLFFLIFVVTNYIFGITQYRKDFISPLRLIESKIVANSLDSCYRAVDRGQWNTLRLTFNDGFLIDTFDFAYAIFDSSGYGLDADSCYTDTLLMEKTFNPGTGYSYYLDETQSFVYYPNHRFRFRTIGQGSIRPFRDSINSPINTLLLLAPIPNQLIFRGESLVIRWLPQNEHNVFILLQDAFGNSLQYYPLIDNGRFVIRPSSLDSLSDGFLTLAAGRVNMRVSFPFFIFISLSGFLNALPLELVTIPGIEVDWASSNPNLLKITPNPASSYILIEGLESKNRLMIFDPQGRLVKKEDLKGKSKKLIFLEGIKAGVYFVKLDQTIIKQKLVVTK